MKNAIQVLRKNGFKVKVTHFRKDIVGKSYFPRFYFGEGRLPIQYLNNYGGMTMVNVITADNRVFDGQSRCSDKDAFNKKNGVSLAIQRCITKMIQAGITVPVNELNFMTELS